jgi:hypothetical protein
MLPQAGAKEQEVGRSFKTNLLSVFCAWRGKPVSQMLIP